MRSVGLVVDPRFRNHQPGAMHPESPERLLALEDLFAQAAYEPLPRIAAALASEEALAAVHTASHIADVALSAGRPLTQFDGDTLASAQSFEAARLAAGASIALVDAVLDREIDSGFAALRPPGHHAEADQAMGFCFFNNVAVAARHLQAVRGLERILIVDWDVHHGNGTQHSFYDDPSVMYVSLHQFPFYPGTGAAYEVGRGAGVGTTVNAPMRAGAGPADYQAAFRELVLPVARRFNPDFVLVSAGFDAHKADPLASIELDGASYVTMTNALVGLADETAEGRIALLLEGGYDLGALAESTAAAVGALQNPELASLDEGQLNDWGREAVAALEPTWGKF
jgi:acetoin utilization deacetylase AcuC-like enzyme